MSGKKQFDEAVVLDSAMEVFWQHGFEGTSILQLQEATGLNKSSLYNAFENKQKLFETCLDRYSKNISSKLITELDHPDYKTAIRGFFETMIARQEGGLVPKGCMVTYAELELGGKSNPCSTGLESNLDRVREAFKKRCQRAIAEGQLPRDTDSNAQSAMLLAMARGIAVLSRGHSDIRLLKDALEGVLARLG
ncbi:MAG: TetR/AcrR family transcriptional regulator [Pseudomonadota bacterium]